MPKICVRCGKEFVRLDQHLQNKKICPVVYLDVCKEDIINNYNDVFSKYIELKKNGNKKSKCSMCDKHLMSKNMSRHIKTVHNTYNITNISGNQIMGDQININMTVNVNYRPNNFGEEEEIDIIKALKIFRKIHDDKPIQRDIETLINYFEELLKIKENRNIYQEKKNKYGYMYIDNKWKHKRKDDMYYLIIENLHKHIKQSIKDLNTANMNKDIEETDDDKKSYMDISEVLKTMNNIEKIIGFISKQENNYMEEWKKASEEIEIVILDHESELQDSYKQSKN